MISTFAAFFDANVFFGARLRSVMLSLAQTKLFRARWSEDIHREWMNAAVNKRPGLSLSDLEQTRRAMDAAVLDCLVTGYEPMIKVFELPDPDDRHLVAAAVRAGASVIATFNQQDFPENVIKPLGIHTRHPDDFIRDIESIDNPAFVQAISWDFEHYRNPPIVFEDYVEQLRRAGVPNTAEKIEKLRILIENGV